MKKRLSIFAVMLCITMFLINVSVASAQIANNNSIITEEINTCNEDSIRASVLLETVLYRYEKNDTISVSFIVHDDNYVANVDYSQSGLSNISIRIDENNPNRILVDMSCLSAYSEYYLELHIVLSNGDELTDSLYGISNEYGVFINPFSYYHAYESSLNYAKENNIITEAEYISKKDSLDEGFITETVIINSLSQIDSAISSVTGVSSDKVTLNCTLSWKDDSQQTHPLRGVKVEVYDLDENGEGTDDDAFELLKTGHTNNDGYFTCEVDSPGILEFEGGGYDIYLLIYAGDDNAMVKSGKTNNPYCVKSSTLNNAEAGRTYANNIVINSGNSFNEAIQISQAVLTARDYAKEMMNATPQSVTVGYPVEEDHCCYKPNICQISIIEYESDVVPSYASWDVIMHEYGHHLQNELGNHDNPGLSHKVSQNDIDETLKKIQNNVEGYVKYDEEDAKYLGIRLAWAESWPTVFGSMAQQYYSERWININCVNDDQYSGEFNESSGLEKCYTNLGEGCEHSIIAVLWDIYDNVNDVEGGDTISLGHQAFWDVSTQSEIYNFSDFIENFYDEYPQYVDDIALNLTKYKMASTTPTIRTSGTNTNPPSLSWTAQGGSTNYPNNSFSVVFYSGAENEDGINAEIARTPFTTQIGTYSTPFYVSKSVWEQVLCSKETSYYVAIASRQTDFPTTGEYISQWIGPFSTPVLPLSESFVIPANTRYTEKIATIPKGDSFEYNVSFVCGGMNIIQTFGSKDAVMTLYDANGNEIATSDDEGQGRNSLISYSFASGAQYKIVINFYSSSTYGKVKLAITPANGESDLGDIEDYEDIAEYETATSTGLMTTLDLFNTKVFVFKPLASGEYTFEIFSSFDTYIYVIDPRSTDQLVEDEDYNDDSEDSMDARLTVYLEANVQYFVIYSDYAPNDMFESYDVIIDITKED